MALETPELDTRDFESLVRDAHDWIGERAQETWTDRSESDPGIVLVELFAYLTDILIYRLNTLPRKAYVEFLRLIGLTLQPPGAAVVTLRFEREQPGDAAVSIPRGTRVTTSRPSGGAESPVFATAAPATIQSGATSVDVVAHHCELIAGELVGTGTGRAGLSVEARRPPLVAPTGDELDLVVGVEAELGELGGRVSAIEHEGRSFRVWQEVDSFIRADADSAVYVVDRLSGTITFAPSARLSVNGSIEDAEHPMAAVPAAGREIRLWYRRGGGAGGNLASGTLTVLKDTVGGVRVTNPSAATGGRDAESLENALVRGPQELLSVEAAVRAEDYEALARHSSSSVSRAKALTRASVWRHGAPGTVDVLLVPSLPGTDDPTERATASSLRERETDLVREQVLDALDERRPLGTTCFVNWTRYKTVRVAARVVVRREEDPDAVRTRVQQRLYQTITPVPTPRNRAGWIFGQPLRAAHVYDIILKEPGVRFADNVRLLVDEVPDSDVVTVVADVFQPRTWYAGSGSTLFRSLNDGDGWEPAGRFPEERIVRVRVHAGRPGWLAVIGALPDGGSRIHVSRDAGETWDLEAPSTKFEIEDAAWLDRGGETVLLLATDAGLYELPWSGERTPVQVVVIQDDPARGFYSLAVSTDFRGETTVAVAAQEFAGVYLSSQGGRQETFRFVGLKGMDVRRLAIQRLDQRSYLWAGTAAAGEDDPGTGCLRWELRGEDDAPAGWEAGGNGWQAGSCWGFAFQGTRVLAATHHGGIVRLESGEPGQPWEALRLQAGVPLNEAKKFLFLQVDAVAADPEGRLVLAAGAQGVHRSRDGGVEYESVCAREFAETVTLPETWVFVSGEHELNVVSEDETGGD
jgi:hypothetical protein